MPCHAPPAPRMLTSSMQFRTGFHQAFLWRSCAQTHALAPVSPTWELRRADMQSRRIVQMLQIHRDGDRLFPRGQLGQLLSAPWPPRCWLRCLITRRIGVFVRHIGKRRGLRRDSANRHQEQCQPRRVDCPPEGRLKDTSSLLYQGLSFPSSRLMVLTLSVRLFVSRRVWLQELVGESDELKAAECPTGWLHGFSKTA